jgi:gluconate 2-dehydrogenase gamma chain
MPGAPGKPGARDAAVLNYIDLALSGAYAELQDFYRRGLAQLDAYCRKTYNAAVRPVGERQAGRGHRRARAGQGERLLWPDGAAFFETLRTHTIEGLFADPVYGGNKDFAGWRLVGFPGGQAVYTPADLQNRQAFTARADDGPAVRPPPRLRRDRSRKADDLSHGHPENGCRHRRRRWRPAASSQRSSRRRG